MRLPRRFAPRKDTLRQAQGEREKDEILKQVQDMVQGE
jgi:hypothetical protein